MIARETLDELDLILDQGRESLSALSCDYFIGKALRLMPTLQQAVNLHFPVRSIYPLGAEIEAKNGVAGRAAFARSFVAALAIRQAKVLDESVFPPTCIFAVNILIRFDRNVL